jgi:hypothetical protein
MKKKKGARLIVKFLKHYFASSEMQALRLIDQVVERYELLPELFREKETWQVCSNPK